VIEGDHVPKKTVLLDSIRSADGHLADGSDDILDGPLPFDTPECSEQGTTVHNPGRCDHGDEIVDAVWCRARTGGVARGQVDLTARKLTGTHSGYGGWATSPVRDRGVVLVPVHRVVERILRCHGERSVSVAHRVVTAGGLLAADRPSC
jgi:hypothetical protein